MPNCSSTAATLRMPNVMNTRSSSRKIDGGMIKQIASIGVIASSLERSEAPLHDGPNHSNSVLPLDLLAFLIGPRPVLNRHFGDPMPAPKQLADQLVVVLKPVGFDGEAVHHALGERLEATLVIGGGMPVKGVRESNDENIADVMREERRLGALAKEPRGLEGESRSHHRLDTAVHNRLHQCSVILRVVLEVSVLDQHDVAGRGSKTTLHGRAFARVPLVQDDANSGNGLQDLPCLVF